MDNLKYSEWFTMKDFLYIKDKFLKMFTVY